MKVTIIFAVFVFLFVGNALALPAAKITIKAVDEGRNAIVGAQVKISFSVPNESGIGLADINTNGITNSNGIHVVSGQTIGLVGFCVDKEGYYQSCSGYEFKSSTLSIRWEPWNPTIEVVMKKKRNPVPMYRKYLEALPIPAFKTPAGYDLEKGEWVVPYGNGVVSDLVFTCENEYVSFSEAKTNCDLTFSNPQDGLQEYRFDPNN